MDLKQDNIMIGKGLTPKLIDFGESVWFKDPLGYKNNSYSMPYCPP